jgi:16S rRNA (guanine966-N2)-methyltransferase
MRVISGDLRGRILKVPPGRDLRPTQGHVRQVLFDIVGEAIVGRRALDLFAGVGGLGIEALSRGAVEVCFVERDPGALRCLRENLESFGIADRARVLPISVEAGLKILEKENAGFAWIFADPPYRLDPATWMRRVARLGPGAVLDAKGTLVFETSRRRPAIERIESLERVRSHPAGETTLEFYRWGGRDGTNGDLPGDV